MIPNGLNPHGLEDRKLVFHLIYDGTECGLAERTVRRYCWARDFPTITVSEGSVNSTSEWAIWENYSPSASMPTDSDFMVASKYVRYDGTSGKKFLMVDSPSLEIHLYHVVPAYTVTFHSNSPASSINLNLPSGCYYPNPSDYSVVRRKYHYNE